MQKLQKISLLSVHYIPKTLEAGVLYVSEEFDAALHLCACGCGTKVSTPLGPTEWRVKQTPSGPSLTPSVGNWQQGCRSHYLIKRGKILWCDAWTHEQVVSGRMKEELKRRAYYDSLYNGDDSHLKRFWLWIKSMFGG